MKIFNSHLTEQDKHRVAVINQDILGWSGFAQYAFFKAALAAHDIKRLLMLGVYHGRDLAYVLDLLQRYYPGRVMELVGVDKFNDTPCADWPDPVLELWRKLGTGTSSAAEREQLIEPLRIKYAGDSAATQAIQDLSERTTWKAAGFGEPPSVARASENLQPLIASNAIILNLYQADDGEFLRTCHGQFGLIYLDTSHDFVTVKRQILQIKASSLLQAGDILAGDDYLAINGWGVIQAVDEMLPGRVIIDGCVWAVEAT